GIRHRALLPRCAAARDRRRHQRASAHHHRARAGEASPRMTLPLTGVRILAVEQYGAGPFGTMFLADQGAEVVKIENPADGGDMSRAVGPHFFSPGDSEFFASFNRNKKSLTLDLGRPEGKAVFHDLVRGADAVASNL